MNPLTAGAKAKAGPDGKTQCGATGEGRGWMGVEREDGTVVTVSIRHIPPHGSVSPLLRVRHSSHSLKHPKMHRAPKGQRLPADLPTQHHGGALQCSGRRADHTQKERLSSPSAELGFPPALSWRWVSPRGTSTTPIPRCSSIPLHPGLLLPPRQACSSATQLDAFHQTTPFGLLSNQGNEAHVQPFP